MGWGSGIWFRGWTHKAMTRALPEIEAAYLAGFANWRDFRLALRRGTFPQPDRMMPDGPRWSEETLQAWLRGKELIRRGSDHEQDLIDRLTKP